MLVYRKLKNTIAGTINGEPFNLPRTKQTEETLATFDDATSTDQILGYVKQCHNEEIAGSNEYLVYNPLKNQYFLAYKGYRSDKAIPKVLVDFIERSYDKDIDFMPIIKAWANLLINPRFDEDMAAYFAKYLDTKYVDQEKIEELIKDNEYTDEVARSMCTYQDIAITKEGLLATYKVAEMVTWQYEMVLDKESGEYVKKLNRKYKIIPPELDPVTGVILKEEQIVKPEYAEDYLFTPAICKYGDKFYSGKRIGYVYEVGKLQYLPETAKRNLHNTFGGGGLYIGGLNYIENYRSQGNYVLTCFVNPADIISFQDDGHAIRVDAVFPNNIWKEDVSLKQVYHSSEYGKTSKARVEKLIKDAVAKDVDIAEEQAKQTGVDVKAEYEKMPIDKPLHEIAEDSE